MILIRTKIIFICLIFSLQQIKNSFEFDYNSVKDMIKFGHEIVMDIFESWELIHPKGPEYDKTLPFIQRMEKELKNRISRISEKIDSFQEQIDIRLDTILAKVLSEVPLQEILNEKLRILDENVGRINDLYYDFHLYSKASHKYERYTLEDFANTCVSSRTGALPDVLKNIHRLLVPSPDEILGRSILILLTNQMQVSNFIIFNTFSKII